MGAMAFQLKDSFDEVNLMVTCGKAHDGCMPAKTFGDELRMFAKAPGGSGATQRHHLDVAGEDIRQYIEQRLTQVEQEHAAERPNDAHGFDFVMTPDGLRLAYCHAGRKVMEWVPAHERGPLRRFAFWLMRPVFFRRARA